MLTAVLYYFGWVRTRATYGYFGVDVSMLNFSVADYVLHSVNAAFPLLVAGGLVTLAALGVHRHLRPALTHHRDRVISSVTATGGIVVAAGLILALAFRSSGTSDWAGPAVLLGGLVLTGYGLALRSGLMHWGRLPGAANTGSPDNSGPLIGVLALAFLAALWMVTAYASFAGTRIAEQVVADLPSASEVTVYSAADLLLSGPGVTHTSVGAAGAAYRFRYTGLRLLVWSGDQYFLLPAGWRRHRGAVIVLPVGQQGLRVEIMAPTR